MRPATTAGRLTSTFEPYEEATKADASHKETEHIHTALQLRQKSSGPSKTDHKLTLREPSLSDTSMNPAD
jgi:hypothetical protein